MSQIVLVNKPDLVRRVGAQGRSLVETHVFPIIGSEAVSKTRSKSDMVEVATKVRDHLRVLGVENARVIEHEGCFPAVFGEIKADVPNAPTILVGGHYDGQPSSKGNWTIAQPHKPIFVTQGGETRFFGRGTSDDWGQVLTHAIAVKMIREMGLPLLVNIKFLIEGGEEVGSENMDKFITAHREMLKCDLVILTDSAPGRMNVPVISTSGRGLVGANVRLKIGDNPPHSGENLAPSALEILQYILSLKDLRTQEVLIPGFYNKVRTLSDLEIAKLRAMPFDTELFIRSKGLTVPIVTPTRFSAQETMWTRPSYQVHTYTDHTHGVLPVANVIPVDVQAYVTMRIVPDQDPHEIFRLFSEEVKRRLSEIPGLNPVTHLTIEPEGAAYPFNTDVSGPEFGAVASAMSEAFDVSEVDFMGCGGTEPIALYYQRILGVPVVFNAYNSPADNYHGHDESMSLERGFQPGVVANVLIYENLYRLRNPGA